MRFLFRRQTFSGAVYACETYERRMAASAQATSESISSGSAREAEPDSLFTSVECDRRLGAMREAIAEIQSALETLGKDSPWSPDIKASDDFLEPLFRSYYQKLNLPNLMPKRNFHQLVQHLPETEFDPEIAAKLDAIAAVGTAARGDGETPSG